MSDNSGPPPAERRSFFAWFASGVRIQPVSTAILIVGLLNFVFVGLLGGFVGLVFNRIDTTKSHLEKQIDVAKGSIEKLIDVSKGSVEKQINLLERHVDSSIALSERHVDGSIGSLERKMDIHAGSLTKQFENARDVLNIAAKITDKQSEDFDKGLEQMRLITTQEQESRNKVSAMSLELSKIGADQLPEIREDLKRVEAKISEIKAFERLLIESYNIPVDDRLTVKLFKGIFYVFPRDEERKVLVVGAGFVKNEDVTVPVPWEGAVGYTPPISTRGLMPIEPPSKQPKQSPKKREPQ